MHWSTKEWKPVSKALGYRQAYTVLIVVAYHVLAYMHHTKDLEQNGVHFLVRAQLHDRQLLTKKVPTLKVETFCARSWHDTHRFTKTVPIF